MQYSNQSHHNHVAIIGGGVSGITTALTLQLLGYNTVCYAEHLVDDRAPSDPRFASLYPAASVIPHSVNTSRMDELFQPSQKVFDLLFHQQASFIQRHRHYEVHEYPVDDPAYAHYLDNYQRLEHSNDALIPHYSPNLQLFGWSFNCLVAEWPGYMTQMYRWYKEAGGKLLRRKVDPGEIEALETDVVINCSGIWSRELFGESGPLSVERGHLLFWEGAPMVSHPDGLIVSYNYTPNPEIYSDPFGNPSDVYFYPRSNGWVLGGSRQVGTIDKQNSFEGKEHTASITLNGVSFPRPILELNRKILHTTFDLEIEGTESIEARIGYRFIRDLDKQGLRLESSQSFDKAVVHNYGHGGAGVTLSWGCALDAGRMVTNVDMKPAPGPTKIDHRILSELQKLLLDLF